MKNCAFENIKDNIDTGVVSHIQIKEPKLHKVNTNSVQNESAMNCPLAPAALPIAVNRTQRSKIIIETFSPSLV
jgi:hypothetical protein